MATPPYITIDHLSVNYRDVQALRNINLTLRPGKLVAFLAPTGRARAR